MKTVTIYTTSSCMYCKIAKEFFKKHGIEYREVDVLSDVKAREIMFQKSHQMGVPVIEIGDEIMVGFNRSELEKLLGIDHRDV